MDTREIFANILALFIITVLLVLSIGSFILTFRGKKEESNVLTTLLGTTTSSYGE